MKDLARIALHGSSLLASILGTCLFSSLLAGESSAPSQKYVVLQIQNCEGKTSYKVVGEKEQDATRKALDEEYQKAKKVYAEQKKTFQKENPGQKFDKPEPKRPTVKVIKRDIKNYHDALQLANDLEKSKNGKNSKNGKTGSTAG